MKAPKPGMTASGEPWFPMRKGEKWMRVPQHRIQEHVKKGWKPWDWHPRYLNQFGLANSEVAGARRDPFQEKVAKTMGEFKRGTLRSSSGQLVTDRQQAVAIALTQARRKYPGYHYPRVGEEIRTGKLVKDEFTLKPGLNSFIAAVAYDAVPKGLEDPQLPPKYVAEYIAGGLGVPAEYVGKEPVGGLNGLIYVIGRGRPVHLWNIGVTDKRQAWYRKLGAPVGDNVYFVGVGIDWRGADTLFSRAVSTVSIPHPPRVISNNWDDGDLEEQKRILKETKTAAGMTEFGRNLDTGLKEIGKYEQTTADWLVPDLVPGAGWLNPILWLGLAGLGVYAFVEMNKAAAPLKGEAAEAALKAAML